MPDPFERKILDESHEQIAFKEIIQMMDDFTPFYISREEFNKRKWDIIDQRSDGSYNLFLPRDLTVKELPAIMMRVNKMSFGDELPPYASSQELKVKLIVTIDHLLKSVQKSWWKDSGVKQAVVKYTKLYLHMYPNDESSLWESERRKEEIDWHETQKLKEYQTKLLLARSRAELCTLKETRQIEQWDLEMLDGLISDNIEHHFYEWFYEQWVSKIRYGLKTMTQWDVIAARKKWDIVERVDEEIIDKKERILRDVMRIDEFKRQLNDLRKTGTQEEIRELEKDACNKIFSELLNYPYDAEISLGYEPNHLIDSKKIRCVWFSIVWSAFLKELGINHYGLSMHGHIALAASIWGKLGYFDASSDRYNIVEIVETYDEVVDSQTIHVWSEIKHVVIWDPDILLQTASYYNKWFNLAKKKKYDEAMRIVDIVISMSPKDLSVYFLRWAIFGMQGKYDEALGMMNKHISVNPYDPVVYSQKWKVYAKMWNDKLSNLNIFVYNLIENWKDTWWDFDISYREEKKIIRSFFQDRDADWLVQYMMWLEKG